MAGQLGRVGRQRVLRIVETDLELRFHIALIGGGAEIGEGPGRVGLDRATSGIEIAKGLEGIDVAFCCDRVDGGDERGLGRRGRGARGDRGLDLPGGKMLALGTVAAMVGTYLCLVLLLLVSRIPWLEREIGHDRMVKLHRTVAPYSIFLILAHVLLTTLSYSQSLERGFVAELVQLVLHSAWMVPAATAFVLMMSLGVLFPEPVWLFHRADLKVQGLTSLHNRKVASKDRTVAIRSDFERENPSGSSLNFFPPG